MYAYHFIRENRRSGEGNRKPWVDGVTERHRGEISPCRSGLHSSPTPFDALQYAPGSLLSLVEIPEVGTNCIPHGDNGKIDKHVSTWRRRILTIDISKELRMFACDVAEEALNREEVQAGRSVDERSRAAIEVARRFAQGQASQEELDAAWTAAGDAARAAAWTAAGDAAWTAAKTAAWDAARTAAWTAAKTAAWDAYKVKFNTLIEPLFAEAMAGVR